MPRLLPFVLLCACAEPPLCNGLESLCERSLDRVTLAMTHNAMSSEELGWTAPNQGFDTPRQLEEGVRGFMLDTHWWHEAPYLCHGFCEVGATPLVDGLRVFADFLAEHDDEVVLLVLEDGLEPDVTALAFEQAGLVDYAWAGDLDAPLPSLGQMLEQGTPLVVTTQTDRSEARIPWLHHAYTMAWDNDYAAETVEDFDCEPFRGDPSNSLLLLNHFLTDPLASRPLAEQANGAKVLEDHVALCETAGEIPNAIAVDFYDEGDVLEVVERLNGLDR